MGSQDLHERLTQIVEPIVHSFGLELWGLETPNAPKGGVLRIYIDSPQGVGIDQCAELSKHLNPILDVEDPIPGSYTLEVSSPGLERPFFNFEQLAPYIGEKIYLKSRSPIEGRKKWRGQLLSARDMQIELDTGKDSTVTIHWDEIKKIHLIYDPPKK